MDNMGGGGGGESGVTEAENVECIFSIFFCDDLHKPVSQKLRGLYQWEDLGWKSV